MIPSDSVISIGKFRRTHALKGELNATLEIDPLYFEEGNPVIVSIDGIMVPFYVKSIREKGSTTFLILLEGIETEKAASLFVNKDIYILKKDAEEWLEEEVLETETMNSLIGYHIIDVTNGYNLGTITDIEDSTANVLFIISTEDDSIIYIPASADLIESIDDEKKLIKMQLPDGLLDLK